MVGRGSAGTNVTASVHDQVGAVLVGGRAGRRACLVATCAGHTQVWFITSQVCPSGQSAGTLQGVCPATRTTRC